MNNQTFSVELLFNCILQDTRDVNNALLNNDEYRLNTLYENLEDYCRILNIIVSNINNEELDNLISLLYVKLYSLRSSIENKLIQLEGHREVTYYNCPLEGGCRGRPQYCIFEDQLTFLRQNHFNWTQISNILNVSTRTLFRHRMRLNFIEPKTNVSDEQLHAVITDILSLTPNSGERYVVGGVRARGLDVPRWRIRNQLHALDPLGRLARRRSLIIRRVYKVKGANYLWCVPTY